LLLPLPFLEVQCAAPLGPGGERTLLTQSGIQTFYGGYSINPVLDRTGKAMRQQAEFGLPVSDLERVRAEEERNRLRVGPALSMIVVTLALIAAGVTALVLPLGYIRIGVSGGCILLGVLTLIIQTAIGWPLENAISDSLAKGATTHRQADFGDPWGRQPQFQRRQDADAALAAAMLIQTRYTVWFWFWLLLILGAVVPFIVEGILRAVDQARKPEVIDLAGYS
jgi:hypothetical protein